MTPDKLKKNRTLIWKFTAILVAFIVIFDILVITQQTRLLEDETISRTNQEFALFGKLIAGLLTKNDYAYIEDSISRWSQKQNDIINLQVIAHNGFVIASYKRKVPDAKHKRFQRVIQYGKNKTATITMTRDISSVTKAINTLSIQLVTFSIILVTLLGFLLQRTAIQPLQKEIIDHEQTEDKLRQHTIKLREINNELETFSYSLSHDLRAPLRAITSFSQIIKEEASQKLNAEENGYFNRILNASNRMAELIDDMLALARVTQSNIQFTAVNLSKLADEARERLMLIGTKRNITWRIHEDLSAYADQNMIALVFDNLFGNAYKYTGKNPDANIEFGCIYPDTGVDMPDNVYFIRDNGVGFDMQYSNKLFKPFQRLHNDSSFEGTGIGLATVQRIIHLHDGKIWAESEKDKGATFYFTLNASPK